MPSPTNPVAFTILGLDIRWYAVFITSSIIISTLIMYKRAYKHNLSSDNVLTLVLTGLPFGIIGARLYYVIFNWKLYSENPLSAFNTRSGGLAVHGGLILGILSVFIACKIIKIKFSDAIDLAAPVIALSQAIGRFGNYFNSEAHGGPTNLPWGIIVNGEKVHPTFLYESIWCFILFFVLIYLDNRRNFSSQTFLLYAMGYSVERFFVEYLRTDSLMIGPFKQAMVFSMVVFITCMIIYIILKKSSKNRMTRGLL